MENYENIIKVMKENNVEMVRLYIYDIIRLVLPKEEHKAAVEFVYDTWVDIDYDIDLAKLTDVVCENWNAIKEDEFTQNDIISEMF